MKLRSDLELYEVVFRPRGFFASVPTATTVFGAICWAYRFLYGEEKLLENLIPKAKEGVILITSPMPEDEKGKKFFFTPILRPPDVVDEREGEKLLENRKKIKRLNFLPEDRFCEVLEDFRRGKDTEKVLLEFFKQEELKKDEESLIEKETKGLRSSFYISRVKLDSLFSSTEPGGNFFFHPVYFWRTNLFVFVACTEKLWEEVLPAFKLLAEYGLGSEKSVGYGSLEIVRTREAKEFKGILWPEEKRNRYITLSPVLATTKIDYRESLYDLRPFRGAIENGLSSIKGNIWKPWLLFLREGSVVKLKEGELAGGVFEHKGTYTYGIGFPVYV